MAPDPPALGEAASGHDRHPATVIALLAERVRRDLYQFVRREARPVTRDEAAAHAGISRKLAAFHLEKLVTGGLLRTHTDRPAAGVGRRPKVYEAGPVEVAVSVPARHFDLLAELLVDAIEQTRGGDPDAGPPASPAAPEPAAGALVLSAACALAEARGAQDGAAARGGERSRLGPERALTAAASALEARGFEPSRVAPRHLVLRNCPFHRLAQQSPELVCRINHAYCTGVLAGVEAPSTVAAVLAPAAAQCCVQLRA